MSNDYLYHLWKGLILFYYITSKTATQISAESSQSNITIMTYLVKRDLRECEDSLLLSCKLNHISKSVAALFLLLKVTIHIEKRKSILKMTPLRKKQEYALKISKIDQYMGYIAWAEIYLSEKGKEDLGK